ncbi:uncharacterized protein LOC133898784 [Phragmites australis]|uniref:uncharacterized protein LOC133898784 n=1 Tax=Phragmites australis TaxID=29695 RepID=UPI002D7989A5|nr:uncharacterized protein LOC133898784 [Phragmites australis]
MAAMRSALAMLSRRTCGSSGSSAAASMGGRGLEIHQVFRPAAPRTPPLRPAAFRNLESQRHFSTGGREPADKADTWWQRVKYRVKNADIEERSRALFVYSVFTGETVGVYMVKFTVDIYRQILD